VYRDFLITLYKAYLNKYSVSKTVVSYFSPSYPSEQHEGVCGSQCVAPRILKLVNGLEVNGQLYATAALPLGKEWPVSIEYEGAAIYTAVVVARSTGIW
jgi:hypothetical protein